MKKAVAARQMPPWFAEKGIQHYSNEKELSTTSSTRWRAGSTPALPRATRATRRRRERVRGWLEHHAGHGVEMPKPFDLPARGTINYQNMVDQGELR